LSFLLVLPVLFSSVYSLRADGQCQDFTVGACDPSKDELIEEYDIPNVEEAVSLCQEVCQIQEGCNFFDYNKNASKCYLFSYRYLDSCQLIGGPVTPGIDDCVQGMDNSCASFVREECSYKGDIRFSKESVTDAHSCQALLQTLHTVYKAEYFVYDTTAHLCMFYSTMEADCPTLSGPKFPDVDECRSGTTTPTPTDATTPPPKTTTPKKF